MIKFKIKTSTNDTSRTHHTVEKKKLRWPASFPFVLKKKTNHNEGQHQTGRTSHVLVDRPKLCEMAMGPNGLYLDRRHNHDVHI
jgi:hypothetical protein